jgi:hypothetical protein
MSNTASSRRKDSKAAPAHKVRVGSAVATVWPNESENGGGPWYNTTLVRVYKNDKDEYVESTSYAENQLLELIAAAQMAHQWIVERHAKDRAEERQSNGVPY